MSRSVSRLVSGLQAVVEGLDSTRYGRGTPVGALAWLRAGAVGCSV